MKKDTRTVKVHNHYPLPLPLAIAINDGYQHIQYNRSPHLHSSSSFYKAPPPPSPMFGRQLSEDPFHLTPIIYKNVCSSRYSKPLPFPPLSKKIIMNHHVNTSLI